MKMRKCKAVSSKISLLILVSVILSSPLWAKETNWVIGAVPFEVDVRGQSESDVHKGLQKYFPHSILSNLGTSAVHYTEQSELDERTVYDLKKKQTSLFLELSGYVKTRDSHFIKNYSSQELALQIRESEKKIEECQKKISENIEEIKKTYEDGKKKSTSKTSGKALTEGEKFIRLFKNLVNTEEDSTSYESVAIYGNEEDVFFKPSEKAQEKGWDSPEFEKEAVSAGIRAVLTGRISVVAGYVSVSASLVLMPGRKVICTVSELGAIDDMDFISSNIARNLLPYISGNLPSDIKINIENESQFKNLIVAVDDQTVSNLREPLVLDSGVHTISIEADGCIPLFTSYFFEGNTSYSVDAVLKEREYGFVNMRLLKPFAGNLYGNGKLIAKISQEEPSGKLEINGQRILGQFVSSEGHSSFFYAEGRSLSDGNYLGVSSSLMNTGDYIEKRRKIMYGGYSAFVVSFMGLCVANGGVEASQSVFEKLLENPDADRESLLRLQKEYQNWKLSQNIFKGLTIGSAVLWAYGLVRYLIAADKVIPSKVKVLTPEDFNKPMNWPVIENKAESQSEGEVENNTERAVDEGVFDGEINSDIIIDENSEENDE